MQSAKRMNEYVIPAHIYKQYKKATNNIEFQDPIMHILNSLAKENTQKIIIFRTFMCFAR